MDGRGQAARWSLQAGQSGPGQPFGPEPPSRYASAVRWVPPLALTLCLLGSACGRKEAADPRQVLGEEMRYGGVDGRTGKAVPEPTSSTDDSSEPADADECQEAAEHLVGLGIDLEVSEAAERQRLRQSERARRMVKQWTAECLERGDTSAQVACILQTTRESQLESCAAAQ